MKNARTHRESYERMVSPRVRKLADGVGLPPPTWMEVTDQPEVSYVLPESLAEKMSGLAATCIDRILRRP